MSRARCLALAVIEISVEPLAQRVTDASINPATKGAQVVEHLRTAQLWVQRAIPREEADPAADLKAALSGPAIQRARPWLRGRVGRHPARSSRLTRALTSSAVTQQLARIGDCRRGVARSVEAEQCRSGPGISGAIGHRVNHGRSRQLHGPHLPWAEPAESYGFQFRSLPARSALPFGPVLPRPRLSDAALGRLFAAPAALAAGPHALVATRLKIVVSRVQVPVSPSRTSWKSHTFFRFCTIRYPVVREFFGPVGPRVTARSRIAFLGGLRVSAAEESIAFRD
jgi:hypothetical protein